MRIIRGSHQRRLIHPPASLPVRPTTDIAKESLFNVLEYYTDLDNIRAMDLFAGTGNISYELMSRGCELVVAIENNPRCVKFIADTATMLSMKNLQVVRADVFRFLTKVHTRFDLVFADPPYEHADIGLLPGLVLTDSVLNPDGVFVLEHPREFDFSDHAFFAEQRKYGKVNFTFFVFKSKNGA